MLDSSRTHSITGGARARGLAARLAACLGRRRDARLVSPEGLRQRIWRERALVVRGRPAFSLLTFDVDDHRRLPATRTLVRMLRRRLRIADEIGWILPGRLAVFLPVTDRSGALALAEDIHRRMGREGMAVSFTLQVVDDAGARELARRGTLAEAPDAG